MARERMVTRTVSTLQVSVMVVHMETKQVETVTVEIPYTDNAKQVEKLVRNSLKEGLAYVQCIDATQKETLYGMPEAEFIRLAKVLPPR